MLVFVGLVRLEGDFVCFVKEPTSRVDCLSVATGCSLDSVKPRTFSVGYRKIGNCSLDCVKSGSCSAGVRETGNCLLDSAMKGNGYVGLRQIGICSLDSVKFGNFSDGYRETGNPSLDWAKTGDDCADSVVVLHYFPQFLKVLILHFLDSLASADEAADYDDFLNCFLGRVRAGSHYFYCPHLVRADDACGDWIVTGTYSAAVTANDCSDLVTGSDFVESLCNVSGFLAFVEAGSWSVDQKRERTHCPHSARQSDP